MIRGRGLPLTLGDLCKTPPFVKSLRCVQVLILQIFNIMRDRGRTASYPAAPSQIPACGITAPGSSGLLAWVLINFSAIPYSEVALILQPASFLFGQAYLTFPLNLIRKKGITPFYQEQSGSPRFHSASLHTCHALATPAGPPGSCP